MVWIISIALLLGGPGEPLRQQGLLKTGSASWYGNVKPGSKKYCYGGYRSTCSPYRKGERVYYAAVNGFKRAAGSYLVVVESLSTGRTIVVAVRDQCGGCTGHKVIDLSPAAFIYLRGNLKAGRMKVRVYGIGRNSDLAAGDSPGRPWIFHGGVEKRQWQN